MHRRITQELRMATFVHAEVAWVAGLRSVSGRVLLLVELRAADQVPAFDTPALPDLSQQGFWGLAITAAAGQQIHDPGTTRQNGFEVRRCFPVDGIESWRSSGMRICSTSSYRVICYRCAVGNGGFPAHGWCPLRSWGPGGATEPATVSAAHGACSGRAISPHS